MAYTVVYGISETFGLRFKSPESTWQVPSGWVRGTTTKKTLIWGSLLGPGLITRNPYAGIWLLPFLIALNHNILLAVVIGIVHGMARAIGVLKNRKYLDNPYSHLIILGSLFRWRSIDGMVLLLVAGVMIVQVVWILGFRL